MKHQAYMARCIELALRAAGDAAPNPMVGCVIVHKDKIISEGWHKKYGEAHAERMAILPLLGDARLKESTLYVNLEPCVHFGKTPPCANLIMEAQIPMVVFGMQDPFSKVNGNGLQLLNANQITTEGPILQKECEWLNRRFITFHQKQRPYIILKWAQSKDGFIAKLDNKKVQISGHAAAVLLHKWRSEEAAILVGANTAVIDKPKLDTRLWKGNNPLRVFFDGDLRGNYTNSELPTFIFNRHLDQTIGDTKWIKTQENNLITPTLSELHQHNILSILVEGGLETLQRFIAANLFDEIRIIKSKSVELSSGLSAPDISGKILSTLELEEDIVEIYTP